jgi:hypothetical protein
MTPVPVLGSVRGIRYDQPETRRHQSVETYQEEESQT